ncbi:MAG: hypothetical protein WC488_01175 [Candidatus Micrarchaeia archaeon]
MDAPGNPETNAALISFFAAILFLAVPVCLFILDEEMMNWGYGVSCIFFFLSVFATVSAAVFFMRSRTLGRMLKGEGLLAVWKYAPEEWKSYAEKEFREESSEKKGLFLIVAGIALFLGIIFFLFDQESGLFVLGIMVALTILIGIIAYLVPLLNYRRNSAGPGKAYISREGVFLNGVLQEWALFGSSLEDVILREGRQNVLQITYSTLGKGSRNFYTVRVPVPRGEEKLAAKIAKELIEANAKGQ